MIILSAVRDFADGLSRGLSIFFTERPGFAARNLQPQVRQKHR